MKNLLTVLTLVFVITTLSAQDKATSDLTDRLVEDRGQATAMVVDGVYLDAREVLDLQKSDPYRDVIRYYVLDERTQAEGIMYGFTSLEQFNAYLEETGQKTMDRATIDALDRAAGADMDASLPTRSQAMVLYYDNTNFVGPTGAMLTGTARCFTNTDIWFNNRIESILTQACACTWTICRKVCASGSSLWIAGGANISDLGPNWNNQITHIQVLQ